MNPLQAAAAAAELVPQEREGADLQQRFYA